MTGAGNSDAREDRIDGMTEREEDHLPRAIRGPEGTVSVTCSCGWMSQAYGGLMGQARADNAHLGHLQEIGVEGA